MSKTIRLFYKDEYIKIPKIGKSKDETYRELDCLDLKYIESYLRIKKLQNIKNENR